MRHDLSMVALVLAAVSMSAIAEPKTKLELPPAALKAAVPAAKAKGGEVRPVLERRVALRPDGVLVLRGKGLGEVPAGRVVVLRPEGGKRLLLKVRRWSPTRIEAVLPAALAKSPLRGRLHLARHSSPDRPVSNVIPVALRPGGTGAGPRGAPGLAGGPQAAAPSAAPAGKAGALRAPGARAALVPPMPIAGADRGKGAGDALEAGRMAAPGKGKGLPLPGGMPSLPGGVPCPPVPPGTPVPPGCGEPGLPREPRPGATGGFGGIHGAATVRLDRVSGGGTEYRYRGSRRPYSPETLRQCIALDPDDPESRPIVISGRGVRSFARPGVRVRLVPSAGPGGWDVRFEAARGREEVYVYVPLRVANQVWRRANAAYRIRFLEGGRTVAQTARFDICRVKYSVRVDVRLENCIIEPAGPWDLGVEIRVRNGERIEALSGARWRWNEGAKTATATVDVPEGAQLVAELTRSARGKCRGGGWERTRIEIPPLRHRNSRASVLFRHVTPVRTERIAMDALSAILNIAVPSIKVRLNTYDPSGNADRRWYRPNDSWVEVRATNMDGSIITLREPIPLREFDVDTEVLGHWYYYVNDLNSSRASFGSYEGGLKIELEFESEGTEIKGRCPACIVGDDKGAPDAELNEARIVVHVPIVFKRAPDPARSAPGVDMDRLRVDGNLSFHLHSILEHSPAVGRAIDAWARNVILQELKIRLARELRSSPLGRSLDRGLVELVRTVLESRGYAVLRFLDARVEGGNLVVRFIGTRRS